MATTLYIADSSISFVFLNLAFGLDAQVVERALSQKTEIATDDIFLFQEVFRANGGRTMVEDFFQSKGFHHYYAPAQIVANSGDIGLAIVSRFPLDSTQMNPLKHNHITFGLLHRIALSAVAKTATSPLTMFNFFNWIGPSLEGL